MKKLSSVQKPCWLRTIAAHDLGSPINQPVYHDKFGLNLTFQPYSWVTNPDTVRWNYPGYLQLRPFISYNWLFLWDYTFYKWGFLSIYNWYNLGRNCLVTDLKMVTVFHDSGLRWPWILGPGESRKIHLWCHFFWWWLEPWWNVWDNDG